MPKPLKVCVDARLRGGVAGGVEQVIVGLASGLVQLDDGEEDYVFLVHRGEEEWIVPYVGPDRLLFVAPRSRAKRTIRKVPPLLWGWHHITPLAGPWTVRVPRSSGVIEQAGVDVMHFTFQSGFLTAVRSLYAPWDLQHRHLPHFFSPRERMGRDVIFAALCAQASRVVAPTHWVKRDLVGELGLPAEKVAVIPSAPVLTAYPVPQPEDVEAIGDKLGLPEKFLFYPSATWPHKNHLRLVEAVALLRREGLDVAVVCSGFLTGDYRRIAAAVARARLEQQIRFVGFVSPLELQSLYRRCLGVILPTEFEGWGMPLIEAFVAGTPVACSRVTCLPEQAGGAALLFDPSSVEELAAAISQLWQDADLRRVLANRGLARAATFTWERTARICRAHYRHVAGRSLNDEDRELVRSSLEEPDTAWLSSA